MEGQLTTHWVQHRGYNIVVDEPLLRIVVCDVRQRLFWAVSQIEFSRHFNSDTGLNPLKWYRRGYSACDHSRRKPGFGLGDRDHRSIPSEDTAYDQ